VTMPQPKILFSAQPAFLPILKELKGQVEIWTTHAGVSKLFADADIPNQLLSELNVGPLRDLAFAHAAEMLQTLALLTQVEKTDELDQASWDMFQKLIAPYLYPRLPETINVALVLDELKPDVIVVHNDVEPATRLMAAWAEAHGVPCLHIPHAVYMDTDERGPIGTDIHDIVTAKRIAAAGPFQAQWYHARDPKAEIRMTATLAADRFANLKPFRADAQRLLNLQANQPVITYFSSWRQDTNLLGCTDVVEEGYRAFLTAASRRPYYQYLVKCHPRSQNVEQHVKLAEEYGVRCIVSDQHLDVFLNATDLAIALGPSNVLVEAACYPFIRLAAINGFANDPEVLTCPADVDALVSVLDGVAEPPVDTSAFVTKYFGAVDGKAYWRLANWIRELAGL